MADVVTLDQVKQFLNINNTSSDGELPFYIGAAEAQWAGRGLPLGTPAAPVDEWYDGGSDTIVVRSRPIDSVQLVAETWGSFTYVLTETEAGTSGYAWAYTVDLVTGTIIRRAAGVAIPFADGERNIHIQYTPGYADVPNDIQLAILLLIKHSWETQRGIGKRPGLGGNDDPSSKGDAYAWPYRVQEIADAYMIPGIA